MADESNKNLQPLTVEQLREKERKDTSWKKKPWIGDDGFEYRRQRFQQPDGSYKVFDVKVGKKPRVQPENS